MTTTAFDDQFVTGKATAQLRKPYDTVAILRRNIADAEKEMQRQAERAESYADTLRSLASYVGAGGYNADTVDADVFEEKIRWGIGEIQDRLAGAIERELVARTFLIEARNDIQTWIDSRNEWMKRAEAAEAELAKLAQQKPAVYANLKQLKAIPTYGKTVLLKTLPQDGLSPLYAAPVPDPAVPAEWREVMAELAADLQSTCDAEHPHRDQYPSVMRKYNNDMKIVEKARALLQSADHSERNLEKVAPDCRTCANRGQVNGLSQESYCDSCIYQGRDWRQNHFVDVSKMVDEVNRRCEACAILPCSCK